MVSEHKKLQELKMALSQLRDDLNDLSTKVNADPTNTSLVIRRVNVMGRIVSAQTRLDQWRERTGQA